MTTRTISIITEIDYPTVIWGAADGSFDDAWADAEREATEGGVDLDTSLLCAVAIEWPEGAALPDGSDRDALRLARSERRA